MNIIRRHRRRSIILASVGVSIFAGMAFFAYVLLASRTGDIKSATVDALPLASLPSTLELPKDKLQQTFTSPALKADFEFNAIAPMWKGEDGGKQHLQIRTADAHGTWTDWMDVEAGTLMQDGKPVAGSQYFPETPIFILGRQYQYRVTLDRGSLADASPTVTDLKINYIDSRQSLAQQVGEAVHSFFGPGKAMAGNSPSIISRADWGSPDANGELFKGTDKYWAPAYAPVKQVFLHHTVNANYQSDPKSVVRGIWNYHANTLGWGDIGYNYLVDSQGNLYQGRYGGDYVIGGHTSGYNTGAMGVAVLGCFEPNSTCRELNGGSVGGPSPATIERLSVLLSWKTSVYGINPDVTHTFCKYDDTSCISIPTIAAHRQANDTECNGQYFFDKMNEVRQKVREKNAQDLWGIYDSNFVRKYTFGGVHELLYATDSKLYASFWGTGYSGISTQTIMDAPFRERFVDAVKIDEPDGTTQTIYAATQAGVYKITLSGGTFSDPVKIITQSTIKKIAADIRDESATTWRVYVLADDGPYEYWWRDGTEVSNGFRLWEIHNGIDLIKSRDPDDLDEIYVATKGNVYRMKWPISSDIQRKIVDELRDTVAIDKQTLGDGTELLYTATDTGVHETWWNASKPSGWFSDPAKIVQTSPGVVDVKKTVTNNYQQLYVARTNDVSEYWWGPGSNGIHQGTLLRADGIHGIDKSTNGTYQNLYTASRSNLYETWWGNGKFGNGVIVQTK